MKKLQCHPVDDINKWINPHRWTTFEEMAEKKAYKIQASVQYANHQLSFQSHVGAFQKSSKIGHQWKLDKYQHHTVVYWVKLPLTVFNWNTNHSGNLVNPLHPNIFSILFSINFLGSWQGKFVQQSSDSVVGNHFLYSFLIQGWYCWKELDTSHS